MEIKAFRKILIANRGEIAIRVIRAVNELDLRSVAVYSKEDKVALFRSKADESYMLDPEKTPVGAYLEGGKSLVSEVHIKDNESLDSALKRFKRNCAKAGVLSDLRKKEYYQSPSVKRRKKSEAARKNKNKKSFS